MLKTKVSIFVVGFFLLKTATLFSTPNSFTPAWKADSWMSLLPNDQKISQINLPGTHDSVAVANHWKAYCLPHGLGLYDCQDRSISKQLEGGIRLLDIRLKVKTDENHNHYFMTCHGYLKIPGLWNSLNEYQPFDAISAQCDAASKNSLSSKSQRSVLEECELFLTAHPSETIVMFLQVDDFQGVKSEDIEQELSAVFEKYASLFYQPKEEEIPNLGMLRGKVYLLIRSAPFLYPGTSIHWDDNTPYEPNAFQIGSCSFYVQDHYWNGNGAVFSASKKVALFLEAINKFHQLNDENSCLINFASARYQVFRKVFTTQKICSYLSGLAQKSPQQFLSLGWNLFDKPFDSYEEPGFGQINCVTLLIDSNFWGNSN